jgi:hypothetical protein
MSRRSGRQRNQGRDTWELAKLDTAFNIFAAPRLDPDVRDSMDASRLHPDPRSKL